MPDDINNLDSKDEGLKAIFGDRFHDETAQRPTVAAEKTESTNTTRTEKAAQNPVNKPTEVNKVNGDAKWQPAKPAPNWLDNLKACAKWAVGFGSLCLLFFYWQQTGQMAASAAVPSMCVCTALAGFGVGKNAMRGANR